jgi:hypothetical protein
MLKRPTGRCGDPDRTGRTLPIFELQQQPRLNVNLGAG